MPSRANTGTSRGTVRPLPTRARETGFRWRVAVRLRAVDVFAAMIGSSSQRITLWWYVRCSLGARGCSAAGHSRSMYCSVKCSAFREQ